MDRWVEVNFDGMVGPTHHFGGLGVGNLASQTHRGQVAHPRAAALQGLAKVRRCAELGARQAILPPQRRPDLPWLRNLGFRGSGARPLRAAADEAPHLLSAAWSASSMWAANAATVSAGSDTADGRTHLTVANLTSSLHRSLEPSQTLRWFRRIFCDPAFVVHRPLPASVALRDEGAANHMRLTDRSGRYGVDVFVFGSGNSSPAHTRLFPRQSLAASHAIARIHRLDPQSTFFLQQHPEAIDAGAFHNDVVATSHQQVWLYHEQAYLDAAETISKIEQRFERVTGERLIRYPIATADLPLSDAVSSYLFNGQLLTRDSDSARMTMLCPEQVRETPAAQRVVESLVQRDGPITACEYVELRESMHNGGGPACLRLRVPMVEAHWNGLPGNIRYSESWADALAEIIERTYPETVELADLTNPKLIKHADQAVKQIDRLLRLTDED